MRHPLRPFHQRPVAARQLRKLAQIVAHDIALLRRLTQVDLLALRLSHRLTCRHGPTIRVAQGLCLENARGLVYFRPHHAAGHVLLLQHLFSRLPHVQRFALQLLVSVGHVGLEQAPALQQVRADNRILPFLDDFPIQIEEIAHGLQVDELALDPARAPVLVSDALCPGLRHVRRIFGGLRRKRRADVVAGVRLELCENESIWLWRVDATFLRFCPERNARYLQCNLLKLRGVPSPRKYAQLYVETLRPPRLQLNTFPRT